MGRVVARRSEAEKARGVERGSSQGEKAFAKHVRRYDEVGVAAGAFRRKAPKRAEEKLLSMRM